MATSAIRPIPKAVHSSLRSGAVLFDLTRVVEELVHNSLDAGATKVSVYIGIRTCYIKIADNGSGINRDGLMLLGKTTSKVKSLDGACTSFGFRGEALGSVSDLSVLEIITKTHGMPNGYRKIIKGCKCFYFGVDDSRQDVGTTGTPIFRQGALPFMYMLTQSWALCSKITKSPCSLEIIKIFF